MAARKIHENRLDSSARTPVEADSSPSVATRTMPANPPKRHWALYISASLFVLWMGFLIYVAYQVLTGTS